MSKKKVYGKIIEKMEITNTAAKGKCIGKHEGKVIFVPFACPGDIADVMLVRSRRSFSEGFIRKIYKEGPDRVDSFCEHFGICGGCKWQHLSYDAQTKMKEQELADNMARIAGLKIENMSPIIASEKTSYYRNKLEYTFTNQRWILEEEKENENKELRGLGFHLPGKFDKILHINKCHLQPEYSNEIRNTVYETAIELNLSFFDRKEQNGFLRNLIIRNSESMEWMTTVVFAENNAKKIEEFLAQLKIKLPEVSSWIYIINTKRNDSMDDLSYNLFSGKDHFDEKMEHLNFKVGPLSFYQTNHNQAYRLYKMIRQLADLKGDEILYDLYTGTGTIALFLAPKTSKVIGIEYVEDAINNANENARNNNIKNAFFYHGDIAKTFSEEFISKNGKADIIITDPPRSGMHPAVIAQILKTAVEKIVYVSCNSATQARDIEMMKEAYKIEYIQAVDMFPHTHHVESIVLLKKIQ